MGQGLFGSATTTEEEVFILGFRRHTLLPLDDCLYALQATISHLTRSSLHRCLQRHGISRLPDVEGDKPAKKKFKRYPIGYLHIDIADVQTAGASCARSWPSTGHPCSPMPHRMRKRAGWSRLSSRATCLPRCLTPSTAY